jgi:hypothetical protein
MSLPFREEQKLQEFENKVIKKIFGPKEDEVCEHFMVLNNEEFYDSYRSPLL